MKRFLLRLALVIVIVVAGGMLFITNGLSKTAALPINAVDFSVMANGHYQGEFVGGRWSNKVDLTIENGKVTAIDFLKKPMFNLDEASNQLIAQVIERQSAQVDMVSGATVTSKAILKAIENAGSSAK